MKEEMQLYVETYCKDIQSLFMEIRKLIIESVPCEVEEKLWAKLPSFYFEDKFVRIIPFKDHINVEASAIVTHRSQLEEFKITPKGMLQIYLKQDIPYAALKAVFVETLAK